MYEKCSDRCHRTTRDGDGEEDLKTAGNDRLAQSGTPAIGRAPEHSIYCNISFGLEVIALNFPGTAAWS